VKIFVTVGTTQYDSLIKAIDDHLSSDEFDISIQLADGEYTPKHHTFFRYTDHIEQHFNEADLVITHAGAGTVFQLLEDNKKMLVIPNQDRVDDHQLDLAHYVKKNNFANVCFDLSTILRCLIEADRSVYAPYENDIFSGYSLISDLLNEDTNNASVVGLLPLNLFTSMDDAVNHIITDEGNVVAGSAIAINPEKVIRSLKEPDTRDAIMSATIRYADGIGVVKTLTRKSKQRVSRIPGCELWEAIMEKSGKYDLPVYLVGSSVETINETKNKLQKQYNVNVCAVQDGYFDQHKEHEIIEKISHLQPKIVTVALGSPRQELFIQECRRSCPNTFFMGVGGSYDVYTNKVKRAPLIYQKMNLEWFYRLICQPKRVFRQRNLITYLYLELTRQL
jgi:UDP-N-acetyl-D-mannosaminouronate:lipid I N-acetyl-D-mannosaminouronosyltransferase